MKSPESWSKNCICPVNTLTVGAVYNYTLDKDKDQTTRQSAWAKMAFGLVFTVDFKVRTFQKGFVSAYFNLMWVTTDLPFCSPKNQICMPYPWSISLSLRGLEKSTPGPIGHHHCFLLITINKFKKNKIKYLSISFIQDGLEEPTPGPVGPHH